MNKRYKIIIEEAEQSPPIFLTKEEAKDIALNPKNYEPKVHVIFSQMVDKIDMTAVVRAINNE